MIRRTPTAPKIEDISAAILAGGTSRRMGTDKALLLHDGKPLIRWVCEAVAKVFGNVFLVTSDPARLPVPSTPAVPDRITGQGPLGGIDAALRHAPTEFTFITGCDMPVRYRDDARRVKHPQGVRCFPNSCRPAEDPLPRSSALLCLVADCQRRGATKNIKYYIFQIVTYAEHPQNAP